MEYYDDFEDFVSHHQNYDKKMYYIAQNYEDFSDISYYNLIDVTHEPSALYIVQPNFYKLNLENYKDNFDFIKPLQWKATLFSQQLLAIVLYDRILKMVDKNGNYYKF